MTDDTYIEVCVITISISEGLQTSKCFNQEELDELLGDPEGCRSFLKEQYTLCKEVDRKVKQGDLL